MKGLITWSVDNPTAINVFMVALLVVGGAVTTQLIPRESFPKIELDIVTVRVVWRGHTPEEVEEAVVIKVEEAIYAISGIESLTSTANHGVARVRVELASGADRQAVLEDVRDAVSEIANFPSDIEPPVVRAVDNRQSVIDLVLYGDVGRKLLRDVAEDTRDHLLELPEVSQVRIEGLKDDEISIEIREDRLRELGLSMARVQAAVRSANIEISSGTLRTADENVELQAGQKGYTIAELRALPLITTADGAELTLGQVADVSERPVERTYSMRFNGMPAAGIDIQKTGSEDTVRVVTAVKSFAAGLPKRLPPGVKVAEWRDRTVILHQRIDLLTANGLVGLALIFLALWLFTRFQLALWVGAGLPVAVLGAAILMAGADVSINMISLFGLLLVSGILVDDAIVVSENVYRHMEEGKSARDAAIIGTSEVFPAVAASIMTTIVAFIPFFFMGGRIGKFVRDIPLVVICCLILSFVESLIILPPHLAHSLKPPKPSRAERIRQRVDRMVDLLLRRPYGWLLTWVLRFRWQMVALGFALFLITIGYVRGVMKFVFFPNLDADDIQAEYLLEPGAPEDANERMARRVEGAADRVAAELRTTQSTGEEVIRGRLTTVGGSQAEGGVVRVELLPGETRDASAREIAKRWQEAIGPVPEARWLTIGPRRRGPFGKAIHVELLSASQEDLEAAAAELKAAIAAYPGAYDVSDDLLIGARKLIVHPNERGRAAGLTRDDIALQLRQSIYGGRVEVIQRGRDELEVWTRLPRADRDSVGELANRRIRTPAGAEVALRDVADWRWGRGLDTIRRYQRRRKVTVAAAVDSLTADPEKILTELRKDVVPDLVAGYSGMSASFEGQFRQRKKMVEGFVAAVPWALAGMYIILVLVFQSYIQAFLVILMIPLGLVGAVVGHVVIDMPLTVLSLWGIVALGGILVNDSIVFVDAINRRLRNGEEVLSAVHAAGVGRFRPILLTTLTTAAGLMPLILEQSRQAQFLIPMAASLAFGLLIGTIFTLGVLPAGFACINDSRQFLRWLKTGYWSRGEALEPAVRRAVEEATRAT